MLKGRGGIEIKMAAVLIFSFMLAMGLATFILFRTRQVMAAAGEAAVKKPTPEPGVAVPTPTLIPTPTSASSEQEREELSSNWPAEILALKAYIEPAAQAEGLDPDLLAAIIKRESWFSQKWCPQERDVWGKPKSKRYQQCARAWKLCPAGPSTGSCTGTSGEIGPAQVMPSHFGPGENPRELGVNISRSAEILRRYIDRKGDLRTGVAAYNCGPNRKTYPQKCWEYANQILKQIQ